MAEMRTPLVVADLVAEHHGSLYRYAYRLTGSVADAEDLTQQTFLVAQQKVGQIRQTECVKGWLFAVLRNNYLKSRRRPRPMPATEVELDLAQITTTVPDSEEIDAELLQKTLDELPDEFKIVVLMFYFEDCSYREIAERLDIPPGTVMSRLSRAKQRLRDAFLARQQAQNVAANRASPG